jgi:hypothetical protein
MRSLVISMLFIAGCASHPSSSPSSTASGTPPTIAIQPTDAQARATLSAVAVQRQVSDAVNTALKNGYHGKNDGGEKVYCRVAMAAFCATAAPPITPTNDADLNSLT